MSESALEHYLVPLQPYLQNNEVSEICINKPQEIFVEAARKFYQVKIPALTGCYLQALATLITENNQQLVNSNKPIISSSLPSGERVEIVMPPVAAKGTVVFSFRKHKNITSNLDNYDYSIVVNSNNYKNEVTQNLITLYKQKNIKEFVKFAVHHKQNVIISGSTGSGKTTFLNACVAEIAAEERIITIEDTPEIKINHKNKVHLLVPKQEQSLANINAGTVFESCLRLRPDRILLAEIRGSEVFAFLEAINSGHPGSITTLHADSPIHAFEVLYRKMKRYGDSSNRKEIINFLLDAINIVIQLKPALNNKFAITEIFFNAVDAKKIN